VKMATIRLTCHLKIMVSVMGGIVFISEQKIYLDNKIRLLYRKLKKINHSKKGEKL
jgi:hypothetical protein